MAKKENEKKEKKEKVEKGMVKITLKHRITIGVNKYFGTVVVPEEIAPTLRRIDSQADRQNIQL